MSADVKVGQVWRSRDRRGHGKTVTVEEVAPYAHGFVTVRSFRKSQIRAHYFVQRYELVKDVDA